jgi:hypothetical protein
MAAWKAYERRVAHALGGRRRPVTGIDRGDGDVFTPMFEVQVKLRNGQPVYLKQWLADICRTAAARDKVGVVVWKTPGSGRPDDEALVVMRWRDFVDLHGVPAEAADAEAPQASDSEVVTR